MIAQDITNEEGYKQAFSKIDLLIKEGFEGDLEKEKAYGSLAESIQRYEQRNYHFPAPTTLIGMIELKMFQLKLKQRDLAHLLEIKESRLSEILSGKRKVNLELAAKLYQKLQIDPAFILNAV